MRRFVNRAGASSCPAIRARTMLEKEGPGRRVIFTMLWRPRDGRGGSIPSRLVNQQAEKTPATVSCQQRACRTEEAVRATTVLAGSRRHGVQEHVVRLRRAALCSSVLRPSDVPHAAQRFKIHNQCPDYRSTYTNRFAVRRGSHDGRAGGRSGVSRRLAITGLSGRSRARAQRAERQPFEGPGGDRWAAPDVQDQHEPRRSEAKPRWVSAGQQRPARLPRLLDLPPST
jgi:hypothetical protein